MKARNAALATWEVLGVLFFVAVCVAICYGGWRLERRWNWKWGYENTAVDQVKREVEPLRKEVQELRERVEKLERARPEAGR